LFSSPDISDVTKAACAYSLIVLVNIVLIVSLAQMIKTRWNAGKTRRYKGQFLNALNESENVVQTQFTVDSEFYSAVASNQVKCDTDVKVTWKLIDPSRKTVAEISECQATTTTEIQPTMLAALETSSSAALEMRNSTALEVRNSTAMETRRSAGIQAIRF
jgi:hypothetical protein